MPVLLAFAFLAGVVTVLSPCILPLLPVILSTSISKTRPFVIILGFVTSFTFFTLFLTVLVRATGIPANLLRDVAIVIIGFFGLSLLIPQLQIITEKIFTPIANRVPQSTSSFVIGLTLGLLWTPCVGPILASVIALALTGTVTVQSVAITLAYSIGTAIPLFFVIKTGRKITKIIKNPQLIQKIFGLIMIVTAIGLYFNFDRAIQNKILQIFPNYGSGLTKIETASVIKKQLSDMKNPDYGLAPELIPGGQWLNTSPLTLASLKGKVVLVDFWTYTCINCIRTLPYLVAWDAKYKDAGLVIVGVHTPEFEFEKNGDNVKKAVSDFGIKYPVVQDNAYATWHAFQNQYWPAHYFIDKKGHIRHTHFGEGEYDESEKIIQQLLSEDGSPVDMPIANPTYDIESRTPELYLGNARRQPGYITTNDHWLFTDEHADPGTGASLILNFTAKNVFLVMGPRDNRPGQVKVYLDNEYRSTVTVDSQKLYDLIKLPTPGSHTLKLEFPDSNLLLFAFTFG